MHLQQILIVFPDGQILNEIPLSIFYQEMRLSFMENRDKIEWEWIYTKLTKIKQVLNLPSFES